MISNSYLTFKCSYSLSLSTSPFYTGIAKAKHLWGHGDGFTSYFYFSLPIS